MPFSSVLWYLLVPLCTVSSGTSPGNRSGDPLCDFPPYFYWLAATRNVRETARGSNPSGGIPYKILCRGGNTCQNRTDLVKVCHVERPHVSACTTEILGFIQGIYRGGHSMDLESSSLRRMWCGYLERDSSSPALRKYPRHSADRVSSSIYRNNLIQVRLVLMTLQIERLPLIWCSLGVCSHTYFRKYGRQILQKVMSGFQNLM